MPSFRACKEINVTRLRSIFVHFQDAKMGKKTSKVVTLIFAQALIEELKFPRNLSSSTPKFLSYHA